MQVLAYVIAAALYIAASVRYAVRFARGRSGVPIWGTALVYLGVLSHAVGLTLYWTRFHEPPLVGLGPSLASLSLLVALGLAVLGAFASARALGLLLAPASALILVIALVIGIEPTGQAPAFRRPWLVFHVSLAFIGYAGWVVAAASGLMYLLQFRELKDKQLGAVFQFFPSLDTLDRLSEWALVTAFGALTLGVLLGWAWTLRFEPEVSSTKVMWGVLAWFVLGIAVWTRFSPRLSSRGAAIWNVAGFCLVFVAYLVAKMLVPETRIFL